MTKKRKQENEPSLSLDAEEQKKVERLRELAQVGESGWSEADEAEIADIMRSGRKVALAGVEALVRESSRAAAAILASAQTATDDKDVRKAVKRGVFRLKQRGVAVEEPPRDDREAPIFKPAEAPEPYGFVSSIDAYGDRVAYIAIPRKPRGWALAGGVLGDRFGLRDLTFSPSSRSEITSVFRDLEQGSPLPSIRTEARHCGALIIECAELMEAKGQKPPEAYPDLRQWIVDTCDPLSRPIIYEHVTEDQIASDPGLADRARFLLTMEPFNLWIVPREKLEPYFRKMEEASHSQLVLAPMQKQQRMQDIVLKAVAEIFTAPERALMSRRLEESAYILFKLGKESEARQAVASALDMKKDQSVLRENAFLRGLVELSIEYWKRDRPEAKPAKPSSSILLP